MKQGEKIKLLESRIELMEKTIETIQFRIAYAGEPMRDARCKYRLTCREMAALCPGGNNCPDGDLSGKTKKRNNNEA